MIVKLSVLAGPFVGKEIVFTGHETFLVGRAPDAHFRLPDDDPYFSRRHFLLEVNPPRCRLLDLNSRNGTHLNGSRVQTADLRHGDEIRAGHTTFRMTVEAADPDLSTRVTLDEESAREEVSLSGTRAEGLFGPLTTDYRPDHPTFPGYRVVEDIGRGAGGVVYAAVRLHDNAEVALKMLLMVGTVGQRHIQRFFREIDILKELQHRNIVRYHTSGIAGGVVFLEMELVRGQDARRCLKERGPLPISFAVRVACHVLKGLTHAHEKGFVHRDVKPSNVLLGDGDKMDVKLADFGLARAYEASRLSGITLQGETGGTTAYMAPEQVSHFREAKPFADQYSTAATLYNLLTGCHVLDLPPQRDLQLIHIVTASPVPILQRRSDLPPQLVEAIHTALAREPEQRFPDAISFMKALLPFAA